MARLIRSTVAAGGGRLVQNTVADGAPTVFQQPQSFAVTEGDEVTLIASFLDATNEEWYEDSVALGVDGDLIFNAALSDNGKQYFKRCNNHNGSTDTNIVTLTVNSLVASIDSVDSVVAMGQTINFTHSNLGTITSWTISDGTTTISIPGTQLTADIPNLISGGTRVVTGVVTLTISDGNKSAQANFNLTAPVGFSEVTLADGFDESLNGFVYQFQPGAAVGNKFFWPTSEGTLYDDADWVLNSPGTMTFYGIDQNDGYMESAVLSWVDSVIGISPGTANANSINVRTQLADANAAAISIANTRLLSNLNSEFAFAVGTASAQPLITSIKLNSASAISSGLTGLKTIKRLSHYLRLNSIPIN